MINLSLYCKHCGKLKGGGGKISGISHDECLKHLHQKAKRKARKILSKKSVESLVKYYGAIDK